MDLVFKGSEDDILTFIAKIDDALGRLEQLRDDAITDRRSFGGVTFDAETGRRFVVNVTTELEAIEEAMTTATSELLCPEGGKRPVE